MTIEREEIHGSALKINSNTYINIASVVLIILATLWIKDGQNAALFEARTAVQTAQQTAKDAVNDLQHYKELQVELGKRSEEKLDALTKIVEDATSKYETKVEAKNAMKELGDLNPTIKIPDLL